MAGRDTGRPPRRARTISLGPAAGPQRLDGGVRRNPRAGSKESPQVDSAREHYSPLVRAHSEGPRQRRPAPIGLSYVALQRQPLPGPTGGNTPGSAGTPRSSRSVRSSAVPRPPVPITKDLLLAVCGKKTSNETPERFLARQTHLHLESKRLGPQLEGLTLVHNVQVLFAYDNLLTSLAGLSALGRKLQQLYLQGNRISDMSGLEALPMLQKLNLGDNRLERISGLQQCEQLEELRVPHQRPGNGAPLQIDLESMLPVSRTLRVLDVAGNQLDEVSFLYPLLGLQMLDLSENQLQDPNCLQDWLQRANMLMKLDLQGNPLAAQGERGYRPAIVRHSQSVEEVDGKQVLPKEREFVRRLRAQRSSIVEEQKQRMGRRPVGMPGAPQKQESLGSVSSGGLVSPPTLHDLTR